MRDFSFQSFGWTDRYPEGTYPDAPSELIVIRASERKRWPIEKITISSDSPACNQSGCRGPWQLEKVQLPELGEHWFSYLYLEKACAWIEAEIQLSGGRLYHYRQNTCGSSV